MLCTGYVITSTSLEKGGSGVGTARETLPISDFPVKRVKEKRANDLCPDSIGFNRTTTKKP